VRQWSGEGCLHVFYATDLSPESIRGLDYARAVQKRFCAKFTIAHVLPKHAPEEKIKAASEKAKALSGCDECEVEILRGAVAPSICEASSRLEADLITIGVKKHTLLREMLLGHTLLEILSGACCPVLTVRL
jgi:nucleotide-binding universal stress UspA family protein